MTQRKNVAVALAATAGLIAGCTTTMMDVPPAGYSSYGEPAGRPQSPAVTPVTTPPRVMLIVDEQSLGTIPTAEVEALGVSKLTEQKVPVVDQDMARANLVKGQQLFKAGGGGR